MDNETERLRYFLKDHIRLETDFSKTGQNLGIKPPPVQRELTSDSSTINLPEPEKWKNISDTSISKAFQNRKSCRRFSKKPLNIEEISFLLWATQGVREKKGSNIFRNVPSAGNRHPLDTYVCIINARGIESGIYIYLPLDHKLLLRKKDDKQQLAQKISISALGQFFIGLSSVVFIWSAVPYRTEWRYGAASHKVIAIDAGHVCQNLYIACSAIKAGTCAIAAYNQDLMDELIGVDGKDEFVIYLAPVGKLP